jgi:hypothetical protein
MHETIGYRCGCGSESTVCDMLPAEFVRVRYYFGQRLGVMELNDQHLYHAGKMAFHNRRLHGYGVVCGLRAEKQKPAAGTESTVLRVSTGAAIDPCGREVALGIDQCVDVAAWFANNKSRPELADWIAATTHPLHVAIRYRECPSDPAPAPRDPCGCDNGGCEYGRVRESFELALFTPDKDVCATTVFPATEQVLDVLDDNGISALIAEGCPTDEDGGWLCLASFDVTLDATPAVVDLSNPDNTIAERLTLLPTHTLQALLLRLAGDAAANGFFSPGPRISGVTFEPSSTDPATAGTLNLDVQLAESGDPPADVPIVEATFDADRFAVSRLSTTNGWSDVTPAGGVTYESTPPRIRIVFTQDLTADTPFLLSFDPSPSEPFVDEQGSPLRAFSRRFRFVADANGALALAPAV